MRYRKWLATLMLLSGFGLAQACPDQATDQSPSPQTGKPLAPKPAA